MAELLPISTITIDRIQRAIRASLSADDRESLRDFIASVDWTGEDAADARTKQLLGEIEGWLTEADEGELDEPTFVERLASVLPPDSDVTIASGHRAPPR